MTIFHYFFEQKNGARLIRLLPAIIFTLLSQPSFEQNSAEKGIPFVSNYPASLYKAVPQTWSIQENNRGLMYFAVQGNILEYDGIKWRKLPSRQATPPLVVRSLAKDRNGVVYYGAYGELGFIDRDSLGNSGIKSIIPEIPEAYRNFTDLWTIHPTEKGIYFQSRESILRISENSDGHQKREVRAWFPRTNFMYAFYMDGQYYVHQQGLGLYKMNNDSLELIPGSEFMGKERMQVMLPYTGPNNEKQYLCGMFYSGLYLFDGKSFKPFQTQADNVFKSGILLYKGLKLANGNYALSTIGAGLVIIDAQGKLVQRIGRNEGLQDEAIYCLSMDSRGMLWLGLDNGISKIDINSPLTAFGYQSGIKSGVLSIKRFEGILYVGTSNGLLKFDSSSKAFVPVPLIPGNQIFAMQQVGNTLLVACDGLYGIRNKKPFLVRKSVSGDLATSAIYQSRKYPDLLLLGGVFGVALFRIENLNSDKQSLNFEGYIGNVPDQVWAFGENKDGTLWAGSQNNIAYLLTLPVDNNNHLDTSKVVVKKYDQEHGFPGNGVLFVANGKNYFANDTAIIIFDENEKRFKIDTTFGRFPFGGANQESFVVDDNAGRIWLHIGKVSIIATPGTNGYNLSTPPLNPISESILSIAYIEDNGIAWIGSTDGLIRYDERQHYTYDQSYKALLRSIKAGDRELAVGDSALNKDVPAISFKNNTLRFEYAAPFYEEEDKTVYQTWLEGFEDKWSDFANNSYKEYTNLPSGKYHFHVRAKNVYDKLSEEVIYSFNIRSPWYSSWWAYLIYGIVALAIVAVLVRWRTHQLHEKHRELARVVKERTAQLSQRVEELAVINSVQEGLVRELDMDGIYELVGEKIREIFNAQVIDIAEYDSDKNQMEDKYAYEKGDRTKVGARKPMGFGKHAIETGQLVLINENLSKKSIEFNSIVPYGEEPKSGVWVPIISGSAVKGIISLQNLDREHAFSDSDVKLITTLVNSMSMALESARRFHETNRLLKETEQRTAELSVINSVQEGLARELDIQGIYDLVGEKIREIFSAQVIDIVTYDKKAHLIEDRYSFEKGDRTLVGPREPKGFREQVIHSSQILLINKDVRKYMEKFGNQVVIGGVSKSCVFVPMKSGNEVIGIISLQNLDHENAFSESDVKLLSTLANSMSVALESAKRFNETIRLLKETEQRTAELAVINSVQEGLAKELDIQGIYELIGEKIRHIFDAQVIDIVTYDNKTNLIEDNYSFEKGDRTLLGPREPHGFRKHVIETRKSIFINENLEEIASKYDNKVLVGDMPKSIMFVPLMSGNDVKGIISLQNVDREHAFSNSDLSLLTTLANSMSVALENARLFDETNRLLKETEQRTAELAVINSVQEGLAKELDIQGIYEMIGEKVRAIFDAQVIDIVTYDSKTNFIEDRYAFEKGDRTLLGQREPQGFRKHVIETRKSIFINENLEEIASKYNNKVLVGDIPKSIMFVPMMSGNEIKGIISLQNVDREHAFSPSDLSLLTTLSNSMSVALENARLFDETNRLLKETEQRTSELAVINSVQEGLVAQMDMQSIYDLVGEKIRNIFNAQIVDIVTYDKANNLIEDRYAYENGDRTLLAAREPNGFRKHVIQSRQTLIINKDIEKHMREYGNELLIGGMTKANLFVPLISRGEVTGVISLQNTDHENAFSDSDVSLLTTLANSMSVALESAGLFYETNRLLKETEQRTAELSVINSVQEGLAKELEIQGIYELVGDKIRQIFNAQVIDIVTYDPRSNLIEDRYAYEKGDTTLLGPRVPEGFRKYIIESGQQLVINNDYENISRQYNNKLLIGEHPKSAVLVPMVSGGKVNGMISLQNLDYENAFSDSNVNLLTTLANSMSVALENARLFDETTRLLKETEQRTSELSVINSVQEGLAKELDIQGIYELVGEKMRELFNAQVIDIVTYDKATDQIKDQYTYEKGDRTLLGPRPLKGFRRHVIKNAKPLIINKDVEKHRSSYDNEVIIGEAAKSLVFVPMITGNEATGVISLQNLDQENAFSDSDINLLTTFANSMSVALENARLFDETNRLLKETEQRTGELSVINSVQEGLARELDIQGIYELVGEKMREIFNAQVIDIVTYDKSTNLIEDRYAFDNGDRTLLGARPLKGFRKHVIETSKSLVINKDLETLRSTYDNTVIIGQPAKSLVLVPMIVGAEVTGVISLQNQDQENAFPDSDVNLLTTFANSMSVALENARLFDETNRLLKETEQRTAELGIINSVQEGLASKLDIQAIYDLVGDKIRDVFDTQGIAISFYDSEKNIIHHPYYLFKGNRIDYPAFELGKGLASHIIQTGQPLLINENAAQRYKELGAIYAESENEDTAKSWLGLPLISGGKVNGTIRLENYEREFAYTESDVSLLQTLANSMSVALENARLFDETNRLLKETEQRKAELAVINNVQEGLVKEFKSNAIYELVGEKLCELFDTQTVLIRTFDHENKTEIWRYAIEKGERQYSEPRPLIWANKQLIETHRPLLINENYVGTAKKYGGSGVSMGKPPKSAVFVPMIVGNVVRGSVSLQNVDKEHAFIESDLGLLTTLTNSMGVALENARLFDETTLLLAEAKQRASELTTVNNISKALASQLDPDDLIKLVGDQIKNLFSANIVYLAILNQKTKTIHFPYQHGENLTPMKLGEGFTSKIILTGEPLLVNKDLEDITDHLGIHRRIGIPVSSYLGVPIPVGDEIIGVLSVQSVEHENSFNENDQRLLSTIAASVGVALRNATLFEDVKLAKMEAEAATKTAEKANEAKSAFLSTVSHELRTPLTSVLGFAKIIRKRLDEKIFPIVDQRDPKTTKSINQISENLQVVISEGERLTHLINDVLDLAKIEAGKMEWNQENVSMTEVAERALAATTALFEQKPLKLVKEIDENLPEIVGDKDKLIQVIINLVSNSVKFTDKGIITCRVKQVKDELIVSISDTGIGIAPEDFGAVFEQFKQVGGDTLTDKPKGTGLGLPICKEIVEHHGGRIWLESKVGKGSVFSFALPVIKTTAVKPLHLNELVKQLKEQMAQSKFKIEGKDSTILVVDDDDSIRSLLHQELSDAGYLIEEATNGKEALERIRKNRPDLIILDVMMPEMNGFDVAAILKNDPQTMDIPIIVLSIVQDKARGYRIGVDRYLTKPIDTALLFNEVGTLLEQGKSKRKVMVVDEDSAAVRALTDVLNAKGYHVVESNGKELMEKAIATQPDIIILNSVLSGKDKIVQTLRFEKGLENVLFLIYE